MTKTLSGWDDCQLTEQLPDVLEALRDIARDIGPGYSGDQLLLDRVVAWKDYDGNRSDVAEWLELARNNTAHLPAALYCIEEGEQPTYSIVLLPLSSGLDDLDLYLRLRCIGHEFAHALIASEQARQGYKVTVRDFSPRSVSSVITEGTCEVFAVQVMEQLMKRLGVQPEDLGCCRSFAEKRDQRLSPLEYRPAAITMGLLHGLITGTTEPQHIEDLWECPEVGLFNLIDIAATPTNRMRLRLADCVGYAQDLADDQSWELVNAFLEAPREVHRSPGLAWLSILLDAAVADAHIFEHPAMTTIEICGLLDRDDEMIGKQMAILEDQALV